MVRNRIAFLTVGIIDLRKVPFLVQNVNGDGLHCKWRVKQNGDNAAVPSTSFSMLHTGTLAGEQPNEPYRPPTTTS